MASGVTRVINRCEEAKETSQLDLSECQLMQVPDAVYHLMRHTELKTCDLSSNVITKIPPKFAEKFSLITDLNLSHNQMAKLPDEFADLLALERLDISHNSYVSLPNAVFRIPHLKMLNASNNHIMDIEIERVENAPSLQYLNVSDNPIKPTCYNRLSQLVKVTVTVSSNRTTAWDDDDLLC